MASSANTGSATYTVTHSGGTTNVVVNQKQNGGTWVKLGSYSFTPSSGHKVELLGANDGRVVADGVRLVGASAQAANIAYIHSDHLGSPQKMTDTSQALTWDGQFDPFGEEFLISGSATNPNRFPGQYADAETGYSYNYSRDYDPTIGRYIESDSIGLNGGVNTYAYVSADPIGRLDPYGLLDDSGGGNLPGGGIRMPGVSGGGGGTGGGGRPIMVPPVLAPDTGSGSGNPGDAGSPAGSQGQGCDCATKFPGMQKCENLHDDYRYNTEREAFQSFRPGAKKHSWFEAFDGPCIRSEFPQSFGLHIGVTYKVGKKRYEGALARCRCCEDTPTGPVEHERWRASF